MPCGCCARCAAQEAKFTILEQAYTEALQAGDSAAALACLREQLAPLGVHPERLHLLAASLMGSRHSSSNHSRGGSRAPAAGDTEEGAGGGDAPVADARRRVLRRLQASRGTGHPVTAVPRRLASVLLSHACSTTTGALPAPLAGWLAGWRDAIPPCTLPPCCFPRQAVIPAEVMLPERRLEELVEQALLAQVDACRLHNPPGARPSLLRDYSCGTEQLPSCTTQASAAAGRGSGALVACRALPAGSSGCLCHHELLHGTGPPLHLGSVAVCPAASCRHSRR